MSSTMALRSYSGCQPHSRRATLSSIWRGHDPAIRQALNKDVGFAAQKTASSGKCIQCFDEYEFAGDEGNIADGFCDFDRFVMLTVFGID